MDDGLKLVLIKHKTALMATLMCFSYEHAFYGS